MRVMHIATPQPGVRAREVWIQAHGFAEHLDRHVEIVIVEGARNILKEEISPAQIKLIRFGAARERPFDLLLLFIRQLEFESGDDLCNRVRKSCEI